MKESGKWLQFKRGCNTPLFQAYVVHYPVFADGNIVGTKALGAMKGKYDHYNMITIAKKRKKRNSRLKSHRLNLYWKRKFSW